MRALLLVAAGVLSLVVVSAAFSSQPKRLTKSQWSTYLTAFNAYAAQTPKTVARFRFCRNSTKYNRDLDAFGRCIGAAAAREVASTNTLSRVLHEFEKKTVGDCSRSLAIYQGGLFFWRSAIIGVERAIKTHAASVATVEGQAAKATHAAERVTADAHAFTRACRPLTR